MLVTLPVGVANSGGVNGFAEIFLTPGPELDPVLVADDPAGTTDPGVRGLIGAINDAGAGNPLNPQKDQSSSTNFQIDHQDRVLNMRGPLTFAFGNYKIVPQVGRCRPSSRARPSTPSTASRRSRRTRCG